MKRIIILFNVAVALIAVMVMGCRKEEPRTLESGFVVRDYPPHCYNGYKDTDLEVGVDCGGACPPCVAINNAPCATTNSNVVITEGTASYTYVFSSNYLTVGGGFTIRGVYGQRTIDITLPSLPISDGNYIANGSTLTGVNSAVVNYRQQVGFNVMSLFANNNQTIYVRRVGSNFSVDFCSLTLTGTFNSAPVTRSITGNLYVYN
jgi:hypothetical protein